MTIFIAAWNAQGLGAAGSVLATTYDNTWGILKNFYLAAARNNRWPKASAYYGMMCESGRPPPPINTNQNEEWRGDFDGMRCFWHGWNTAHVDENLRCSFTVMPNPGDNSISIPGADFGMRRPVIRTNIVPGLIVYLVHLPSGNSNNQAHVNNNLDVLINITRRHQKDFTGAPAIIIGDMNINFLEPTLVIQAPAGWVFQRTYYPTRISNRELDWGLSFNCRQVGAQIIGGVSQVWDVNTQQYVQGPIKGWHEIARAVSDHSVVGFTIDI